MKLSLLSFNTFSVPFYSQNTTARYQKIAEIIDASNVEIVCLQEISTYYHYFLIKRLLKKYPYIIKKNFWYGPKGGLIIASKIPLTEVTYTNFASLGSFKNVSFYTQLLKNGMLTAKLKDQDLYIVNTHTVTDMEFEWSSNNKLYHHVKGQINEIIIYANKLAAQSKTLLIMGDFNVKKNSQLYTQILKQTKAIDLFRKETSPTYFHERLDAHFPAKSSERIDFIFYVKGRKKLTLTKSSHIFEKEEILRNGQKSYLSDHIGLKIDFDIV